MKKPRLVTVIAVTFVLGAALGSFAAKKGRVDSDAWRGVSPEEAAARLLELAQEFAENGSWENIHVARVRYLSGDEAAAEAVFDRYRHGKAEASDLIRIARVYAHAGDWQKAKPLLDQVVALEPKDEDWLIEVGAFYNLNGDREHAEELFERGFASAPRNLNNTLTAAGSYVGVYPRRR